MDIITVPGEAATWTAAARRAGHLVGFVPTMGALHAGHLTLVQRALAECGRVVCSIYVNPLQFNDPHDLAAYPRQEEQDLALLREAGCHAVFLPSNGSLFQGVDPIPYDLGGLDQRWEGSSRPGHFQGVVNVVERLFHFVRPDAAYFGEKDRQQLAIIRHVARSHRWPVAIIGHPTVREPDGLALSSRNTRLSPEQRRAATVLHRALQAAAQHAFQGTVEQAHQAALDELATEGAIRLDHCAIVHPGTLEPLTDWNGTDEAVVLVAAYVGKVRLIDNRTVGR